MKKFLAVVILVPIAIIAVALSVANRHAVPVSLDPFNSTDPSVVLHVPLFVLVFGAVALGVLLGGVGAWLSQGRWRKQARRLRHELTDTRRENTQYRAAAGTSPGTTLPAPRRAA